MTSNDNEPSDKRPDDPKDPRASGMLALVALVVAGALVAVMIVIGG